MFNNLRPLKDRVLVQIIKEEQTQGGLYMTGIDTRPKTGTVLAHGPGKSKEQPISVKKGDKVYFSHYNGTELSEDIWLFKEDELLGIIED